MNRVASYKAPTVLATDKRVNLIYGLNGTGKSTLSDYLYDKANPIFSNCSIEGASAEKVIVYNRKFINDYFFETEDLKGVFTLSKQNKDAELKIREAEKLIEKLNSEMQIKNDVLGEQKKEILRLKQIAENKCWEIKTNFCGGDRVLEYCLDGLKGQKEKLFSHIAALPKPLQQPSKTTEQLKEELEAVDGDSAQKYQPLSLIDISSAHIESNALFQKVIIGNEDSPVASLIQKFENTDWVKAGLKYLPAEIPAQGVHCPFCQEITITEMVRNNIQNYFDKTYEDDINQLQTLDFKYGEMLKAIQDEKSYSSSPFIEEQFAVFEAHHNKVLNIFKENSLKIAEKLKNPSQKFLLESSEQAINSLNDFIKTINNKILLHNARIANKKETIEVIKKQFWEIMRWNYDQTIAAYKTSEVDIGLVIAEIQGNINTFDIEIEKQNVIIAEQQKLTVNIDIAVANINNGLLELGIDSFRLTKHKDVFYRIIRDNHDRKTFHTLSEGEKMIITFLYYLEMCTGKEDATDTIQKKIIVIDDPISSLSHIYVFNIGQLIKRHFTGPESKFEQVFIFTHCLYFFYELCFTKKDDRDLHQNLFRIVKSSNGSAILPMSYQEIQNDYQSYWHVIKDEQQSPALIANCMRNIIEYFFGFVEKAELSNVFQKKELKADKYQAFYRYMNRESHSISQNIFDIKEFDYQIFRDAFKLLFEASGYENHYKKMIK
jgi:wobble nucleotide-excising tRNase